MRSEGDRAGIEVSILRTNESKFIEHKPKHSLDDDESAVAECWLECEDKAVFSIRISKCEPMTQRIRRTEGWRVKVFVDGSRLSGSYWPDPSRPMTFRHIYRLGGDRDSGPTKGRLAFAFKDHTNDEVDGAEANPLRVGEIRIDLTPPGTCSVNEAVTVPHTTRPSEVVYGTPRTSSVDVHTSSKPPIVALKQTYDFVASHSTVWQSFIFKAGHSSMAGWDRAEQQYGRLEDLQAIGVVDQSDRGLKAPPIVGLPISVSANLGDSLSASRRLRRKERRKRLREISDQAAGQDELEEHCQADISIEIVDDELGTAADDRSRRIQALERELAQLCGK